MTLAAIVGIWSLLGTPLPRHAPYLPQTQAVQQVPDSNPQRTAPKPKAQDQATQQSPAPESKPQEPAEQPEHAQSTQEQPSSQQPASSAPGNAVPGQQSSEAAPEKAAPEAKAARKPAAGRTKHRTARTQDPARTNSEPKKVVVQNGGTSEPRSQLSPGMSEDQATHSRQTISRLLASTEENLKRTAGRTLTPNEQAMVEQIHTFMSQAEAALKVGDLQRGHNLANKAHLLSDDLVQR